MLQRTRQKKKKWPYIINQTQVIVQNYQYIVFFAALYRGISLVLIYVGNSLCSHDYIILPRNLQVRAIVKVKE
jgi:hypothetical protein